MIFVTNKEFQKVCILEITRLSTTYVGEIEWQMLYISVLWRHKTVAINALSGSKFKTINNSNKVNTNFLASIPFLKYYNFTTLQCFTHYKTGWQSFWCNKHKFLWYGHTKSQWPLQNSLWNNTKPVGPLQWFRIGNYHKPQYSKVKQPLIPDKTCPDKAWKALVRSKTSQWLAVFIDVHTRGVCQLVDISFNLVYILRLYPSGLLGEVKECIIFGVATWLGRTPLIKGLLCFTQLCLV